MTNNNTLQIITCYPYTLQITTHYMLQRTTNYKEQITTNYKYKKLNKIKIKHYNYKQHITHKHYKSGMCICIYEMKT